MSANRPGLSIAYSLQAEPLQRQLPRAPGIAPVTIRYSAAALHPFLLRIFFKRRKGRLPIEVQEPMGIVTEAALKILDRKVFPSQISLVDELFKVIMTSEELGAVRAWSQGWHDISQSEHERDFRVYLNFLVGQFAEKPAEAKANMAMLGRYMVEV